MKIFLIQWETPFPSLSRGQWERWAAIHRNAVIRPVHGKYQAARAVLNAFGLNRCLAFLGAVGNPVQTEDSKSAHAAALVVGAAPGQQ